METASEAHGRWALLIGINHYPHFPPDWQLEGCGNDVAVLRDALSRRFGFREDQIAVLRDEQATREGILAAMEALVRRAGKDDEVVFFYSGHGSYQSDGDEADEADGKDETLVPHDSGRDPEPNRDISDDEIYLWLLRLTAKTPFVTLIFDCCHSGNILRDAFAGKMRGVPGDERPANELAARIRPEEIPLLAGGDALRRLGDKYVAILACGSHESANEIPGTEQQATQGALTYHLSRALLDPCFTGATWREVCERIFPQVSTHFRTQHPELEGARDREVLGGREIPPMTFLPVQAREGDAAVLSAGEACGLTKGSQWAVYAPATRSIEGDVKRVGTVEISSLGATSSEARVVEEETPRAIGPGMRAVEAKRPSEGLRLTVKIAAPPGHPAAGALTERLKRSLFLWQAGEGERADVCIYLAGPRTCALPTDPAGILGPLPEETWAPIGWDGDLVAPTFPCRHPEASASLVENLENVARARGLMEVCHASNPLEHEVDVLLHRLEGKECVPPAVEVQGEPVFYENDRLAIEIGNRSKKKLYIYVIDIGLTYRVTPIFPVLGAHEALQKGHRIRVGCRAGDDLQLFIPQDFHRLCRAPEGAPVEGRETLKLFATPSPADFNLLYQPPVRFAPRAGGWALHDVLKTTLHGGDNFLRTGEDWVTLQRSFRLRSR